MSVAIHFSNTLLGKENTYSTITYMDFFYYAHMFYVIFLSP